MKPGNTNSQNLYSILAVLLIFSGLMVASVKFANYKKGLWENDLRANLQDVMTSKKSKLEKALYSRIYYTRGVAAYVSIKPDITDSEFHILAEEYIKNDTVISTMALSRNCVINAIYPMENHESAIGLDLLEHPERREIVEKTIETKKTYIAGPVELVEGGIAFISYTPIFENNSNNFWGVTDIVIMQNSLLHEAGLSATEDKYTFALRGYNGKGSAGAIFWGNPAVFENKPVTVNIELPTGTWQLAGTPVEQWKYFANQDRFLLFILLVSSFIICVLLWLVIRSMLKIRNNERELRAVFNSLDSIIIEYDKHGNYVNVNSINEEILIVPRSELIGKNISHFFAPEEAQKQIAAIQECLKLKQLVVIEYVLQIQERKHWFLARISYKNENSVIYNAYDITELKEQEKRLKETAAELMDLNTSKDKLFSIVAHDLKGPVGAQKALLEITVDEYDVMSDERKKEVLINLKDSSYKLNSLLENLLTWSVSQAGKIRIENIDINLKNIVSSVISQFQQDATSKNITVNNKIEDHIWVKADLNIIEIILRNLISNAVKFSKTNGEVNIYSEKLSTENQLNIFVSDNGIGMNEKTKNNLFKADFKNPTSGTGGEKGNGLGLLLCQELALKQGSRIIVNSVENSGSTFCFALPLVHSIHIESNVTG